MPVSALRRPIWMMWLLIATIAFHAMLPFGLPGSRIGSAFSATTSEVALAPKRGKRLTEVRLERRLPDRDPAGFGAGTSAAVPALAPSLAVAPALLPSVQSYGQDGPNPRNAAVLPLGARAPPAA